ncbi:MAG: AMP-binding protein [Gammaproteobacteria bacterium]|nr:AMP-binding protein [Gammaproteobacteria bacterium]MYJ52559.1 AMP-binding protein [Gammaproteobacteria bacterium]
MLPSGSTLKEVRNRFRWDVPDRYNMAVDVCDRWAETQGDRVAIIHDHGDRIEEVSFSELRDRSNRLASILVELGLARGDRVGILLPQNPWTATAHIAVWKMAGISIPLFTLFGEEALEYRLNDSAARAIVTNAEGLAKLSGIRDRLPNLERILCIDGPCPGALYLPAMIAGASARFDTVDTHAEDPALIVYTSGTTGSPKGALHAQRTLLGHLPGVEMSHDFLPQDGDRLWTPADWAWIGGLMDVLMPGLYHGLPVVSYRMAKFDGRFAFDFLRRHRIRNTFIPPTALKMMRMDWSRNTPRTALRSIASAGESLGTELLEWGRDAFGLWINEFYGQTECNMIVSSCGALAPPEPGVMGFAVPGHDVQVIDGKGRILGPGQQGQIAVRGKSPVMFLEYWNNPEKTREKYSGEWLLTGDTGMFVESGAIRFVSRDDDVITSAGYRIGPGEIENCLLGHPAVAICAVVGKPDPLRTEIVKAFVRLNDGYDESEPLVRELKEWVRTRLSAHEYPREIAFIEEFPLTTTGKIIRRKLREIA